MPLNVIGRGVGVGGHFGHAGQKLEQRLTSIPIIDLISGSRPDLSSGLGPPNFKEFGSCSCKKSEQVGGDGQAARQGQGGQERSSFRSTCRC